MIIRGDGLICSVNAAFARMVGYKIEELIGQDVRRGPEAQAREVTDLVTQILDGAITTRNIERAYRHRDGNIVWASVDIHMLPLPPEFRELARTDRALTRFIGVAQDITARKVSESQLREQQEVLEEAQRLGKTGHWTWDVRGNRMAWSDELFRMVGTEPGSVEMNSDALARFLVEDDLPRVNEAFGSLKPGRNRVTFEHRMRRSDGELRTVACRWIADCDEGGKPIKIVGTLQDITDRKRQEEVLREAMLKAEEANRAKTNFLAAMSHELRTPLNAILGFAQMLSLRTQGELSPAQSNYVANIRQGGEHLLHLINDVLDLARIDTGKLVLNLDRVDAGKLIQDVIEDFRPMAGTRGIALRFETHVDGPVHALADRIRLMQVLVNLASNAIKYNRTGGAVTFRLEASRRGWIRVSVEDTGRGIPTERHPEVFESFNRLGAEATGEEGTGIGLSLSKRLIEQMGGVIGFHSAAEQGSMFWIELPVATDADGLDLAGTIAPADAHVLAS